MLRAWSLGDIRDTSHTPEGGPKDGSRGAFLCSVLPFAVLPLANICRYQRDCLLLRLFFPPTVAWIFEARYIDLCCALRSPLLPNS